MAVSAEVATLFLEELARRKVPVKLGQDGGYEVTVGEFTSTIHLENLSRDFERDRAMFLEQALLTRSSPAMFAWTLRLYVDWEIAIADAVAPRFTDLVPGDPRPRMLGALTMAAARLACDIWVADDGRGDLPALLQQHLAAIAIPAAVPA